MSNHYHRHHYRGKLPTEIPDGEKPAWASDEATVKRVQAAILAFGKQNDIPVNLGNYGPKGDGVDGKYGEDTRQALADFTPDQRAVIFNEAGVTEDTPPPSVAASTQTQQHPSLPNTAPLQTGYSALRSTIVQAPANTPHSQQPLPAFAQDPNRASFASRDASGKLVAGNNVDKDGFIASPGKVAMLWSALDQIQKSGGDKAVKQFVQAHQSDINDMMSYAHPHHYNQAARNVAHAAALQLGMSDKEFIGAVNQDLSTIKVGGDRVHTSITNATGGGKTTMRDLSAIMYQAAHQFPAVFQHDYHNKYRHNVFPDSGTYGKPGELAAHEAGNKNPMINYTGVVSNGGTIAVYSDHPNPGMRDAAITAGIRTATDGALGQPMMAPAQSQSTVSNGFQGGTNAVDPTLPVFNWANAEQTIDCLGTQANRKCGHGVREILDSGGVHVRTANGGTVPTGKDYGPVLANNPAWTPVAEGDGGYFNTASTKQAAGDPNRLVVVVMTPKAGAHLADGEENGHVFVVDPKGHTHSGFNQATATGLINPGNFTYTAYAYNGPTVNDATMGHRYAQNTARTEHRTRHTTRTAQVTHNPHLQMPV